MDKKKYTFFIVAIILLINVLFRIPVTPHEKGADSFLIHLMANSISNEGYIKWSIHPLSILGLYPLSYSSGAIITLSSVSQLAQVNMEHTILVISIILGIIAALCSFILAGEFNKGIIFRFFVAVSFSLSQIFLSLTQWSTSTRSWFVALLPLFIWSVIKAVNSRKPKYYVMSVFLFILLALMHRIFFFNILLVAVVILTYAFYWYKNKNPSLLSEKSLSIIQSVMLLITLSVGFFLIKNFRIASYKLNQLSSFGNIPLIESNSLIKILQHNILSLGILGVFIIPGVFFLFFKKDKKYQEYLLSFIIILFGLLITEIQYSFVYSLIFLALLSGYGVNGIFEYLSANYPRIGRLFVVGTALSAFILLSVIFIYDAPSTSARGENSWAGEDLYSAAIFFSRIDTDKAVAFSDIIRTPRVFAAYSQKRYAVPGESDYLIYNDIDTVNITITWKSAKSYLYDFKNPFTLVSPDIFRDTVDILYYQLSYPRVKNIIKQYDIGYILDNKLTKGKYVIPGYAGDSRLLKSVYSSENKIYDNQRHVLWQLDPN